MPHFDLTRTALDLSNDNASDPSDALPGAGKWRFRVEFFCGWHGSLLRNAGLTVDDLSDALKLAVTAIDRLDGAAILYCDVTDAPERDEDFAVLATVGTVPREWISAIARQTTAVRIAEVRR